MVRHLTILWNNCGWITHKVVLSTKTLTGWQFFAGEQLAYSIKIDKKITLP